MGLQASALRAGVHWHDPKPTNCSAWRPPALICQGPQLLHVSNLSHCIGNCSAQLLCEEHADCAGLYFDRHKSCRMLLCPDVHEREFDRHIRNGVGGCTQRFVSQSAPPTEHETLLNAVSDVGCSPSGFVMRHLRSQRALLNFIRTPARYFTILERGGRTWLVWKSSVIDGSLQVARLEGADAALPTLRIADNETLVSFEHKTYHRPYRLTHNTALLIHNGKLHAIGGRDLAQHNRDDGGYLMSKDAKSLAHASESQWSPPIRIIDGFHEGCIDGRLNRDQMSPLVLPGVCEFDGRFSLVFFQGKYLLYTRANPTLGRRFVQVTTSRDMRKWSALRSIRLQGVDACSVNIYTFSAQPHPLRNDRLIAFYPVIFDCQSAPQQPGPLGGGYFSGVHCTSSNRRYKLGGLSADTGASEEAGNSSSTVQDLSRIGNCSLRISCSANGESWSRPFELLGCRSRLGQRTASLPVANGLRFVGNSLFVWVHQDVPIGLERDMKPSEMRRSKLVRYELDGAAFKQWSEEECGAALANAREAPEEELQPRPYNSSLQMKSMARLWYLDQASRFQYQGATKELRDSGSGWCGSAIPRSPWSLAKGATARNATNGPGAPGGNDDFFFGTRWLGGRPKSLSNLVQLAKNGTVVCVPGRDTASECKSNATTKHICCG